MVAKQKILIVDDDNNIAELISLYLTKECFETKIVNDGELALKEFQTFRPNLILLDLMLPVMNGMDVCRQIREFSDVPIIMLTAKGEDMDKILGLEYGADDYIAKLLQLIWGKDYPGDERTVDVHVRRLREKIEPNPSEPRYVQTKWGVGYYYQGTSI